MTTARSISSGYQELIFHGLRGGGLELGRSSAVRLSPACNSFAHTSSPITRGSGPTCEVMESGVARLRAGSKRSVSQPHSWQSRKNIRIDESRCAFALAVNGLPTFCAPMRSLYENCPTVMRQTAAT